MKNIFIYFRDERRIYVNRIDHNVRQDSTEMGNINQSILSFDVSYPKSLIINTTDG